MNVRILITVDKILNNIDDAKGTGISGLCQIF